MEGTMDFGHNLDCSSDAKSPLAYVRNFVETTEVRLQTHFEDSRAGNSRTISTLQVSSVTHNVGNGARQEAITTTPNLEGVRYPINNGIDNVGEDCDYEPNEMVHEDACMEHTEERKDSSGSQSTAPFNVTIEMEEHSRVLPNEFHAARIPIDGPSENSTSSSQNYSTSISWFDVWKKLKPPNTWNLTYELMRRESGLSRDGRSSLRSSLVSGFNTRFYSSRYAVEHMKVSECLQMHNDNVNSLNFDRSGQFLCSGSTDRRIIVWNWAEKRPKFCFDSDHTERILQTKFIDSTNHLDIVSSCRNGQVRRTIVSPAGGQPEATLLYRHKGPVHQLVTNPGNSFEIISAGDDGHIRFKDLRSNDPVCSICEVKHQTKKRNVRLFSIAHHPFSPQICVAGWNNFVRVYDKRNMQATVYEMCPAGLIWTAITQVASAVYDNTGREVLASYSYDDIYLFNNVEYKTGDYLRRYQGHRNHITKKGVSFFGPKSDYVICGSDCGNIFVWDKKTKDIVNLLGNDFGSFVTCLEPHPQFPVLATSGLDDKIKVWTPCSPTVTCLEPHPQFPVLATSGLDDKIKVWTPCSPTYSLNLVELARIITQNKSCSLAAQAKPFMYGPTVCRLILPSRSLINRNRHSNENDNP